MNTRQPIAIIGMAGRFAGASSVEELWQVLRDGIDATSDTPKDRYDLETFYFPTPRAGKVIGRRAGYLSGVDQFDADFFGLSDDEAKYLDPQQRLLMTTAWEALEDAGVPADRVAGTRTGVYVGASYTDYTDLVARQGSGTIDLPALFNFRSLLPGRISYLFDLRGPSIYLDTACSSSLVAIHLACQSLRVGETRMALAAGVNLKLVPDRDMLFSLARVVAPDGRSKFGDAAADGAGFSDGVGVVVLKPLGQALADGDRVRAVILGGAVSNDGASGSSLLTPSVEGQAETLRWAYRDAGVNPTDVDFVEAHGNGTPMMDPVEFAGLNEVLGQGRPKDRPCYVGSVKTNIGHPESAAGVAALIKTVLCLENRQVVPSLHFTTPNPDIAWADIPFKIPTALTPLPDPGRPVIAGISGQGISSVNVHLVIEGPDPDWVRPRQSAAVDQPRLLVLSARSAASLNDLARAYLRYLRPGGSGHQHELRDICHSAATRRQHHAHRLAVIASNRTTLISKLRAYLAHERVEGVITGGPSDDIDRTQMAGAPPNASEPVTRLYQLACRFARGRPVQWEDLTEPGARYVSLPSYPWRNGRYWLDPPDEGPPGTSPAHPPSRPAPRRD